MAGTEVTGDFKELEALAKGLARLAEPTARRAVNKALGVSARSEVDKGFLAGRDPYGRPWPKLRSREGQPLRDSGQLQNSFRVTADASAFVLEAAKAAKRVAPHQHGATIRAKGRGVLKFRVGGPRPRTSGEWRSKHEVQIPKRQMVPEVELGPVWSMALQKTANAWLEQHFARAGARSAIAARKAG